MKDLKTIYVIDACKKYNKKFKWTGEELAPYYDEYWCENPTEEELKHINHKISYLPHPQFDKK